jgi:diguanylate cyclase (GGDEF)-like protein
VDLSVLPTLCALTVFVCCFRPLVRRAGPHTNVWFAGWGFLLLHYVALLLNNGQRGLQDSLRTVFALCTLDLCALCFVFAASNAEPARVNVLFIAELSLPLFLQSFITAFGVTHHLWSFVVFALLLVPGAHLLLLPQQRSRTFNQFAIGIALLAVGLTPFVHLRPNVVQSILFSGLFVSAAYLIVLDNARLTRGTGLMVTGLTLWGLSYLLTTNSWLQLNVHLQSAILDLPKFLAAAGMILSLLDDYVGRTESLALHDPLTGLPNRRLFELRLDQAIEDSARTRTPIACLVIDVDNFKYINDTFGHPVGDGLLKALAKRLSWNLGPRDMLARTGGDEFTAVLVEAADEYHIRFIAGAMMAAGCVPVSIHQHAIDVRISIGIAVSPQDAGDSSELHKAADDAMYQAKRRGGSLVAFANEAVPQIHAV